MRPCELKGMDKRQEDILSAIISEYQKTGQPVASAVLAKKYGFGLSPATMRSQMLTLDKEGFLEQPHTSAGRVPTTKAYRFFVNKILERQGGDSVSSEKIKRNLQKFDAGKDFSYSLAQFLAEFSHNLGLSGSFGREIDFHGAGLSFLLEDPEFNHPSDMLDILHGFDSLEKKFTELFEELNQDIEIFIGEENPIDDFRECSLIVSRYDFDNEAGVLGILGPKRMNYAKNISLVEETKKALRKKN